MHAGAAQQQQEPGRQPLVVPAQPRDLAALVKQHFTFVWRSLRRLGLESADADDGAQQVFMVLAGKLEQITPGKERAFLFGTAVRVASRTKRTQARRRETSDDAEEFLEQAPGPEEAIDHHRAQAMLASVLEAMPEEIRAVFILYEFEQLTMLEISEVMDLAPGTVASRLRRGRDLWERSVMRLKAKLRGTKGTL